MEYYTKDIKALAQKMGKKFSCGSSVAVDDILGEVISVQGDVEDRLLDLLETDKDFIALAIPEEKIDFQDQGNKKGRKRV
jgi:translation initiation factor 1 (eIF-1/SUI1)